LPTLDRAYEVPSLRNVAERAPYMDGGSSRGSPKCWITTIVRRQQWRATANCDPCGWNRSSCDSSKRWCGRWAVPSRSANLLLRGARTDRDRRSRHRRRRQRRARCRRQRPAARPARSRRPAFCQCASSATSSQERPWSGARRRRHAQGHDKRRGSLRGPPSSSVTCGRVACRRWTRPRSSRSTPRRLNGLSPSVAN